MTGTRSARPRTAPWYVGYRSRALITDTIAVVVAVFGAQFLWFGTRLGFDVTFNASSMFPLSYSAVSAVLVIAWLVTLELFDTRDRRIVGVGLAEYRRIVNSSIGLFGVVAIIAFLLQILLARGYIVTALPAGVFLLLLGRLYWRSWLSRRRRKGLSRTQIIMVGSEASVRRTVHEFSRGRQTAYTILAIVLTSSDRSAERSGDAGPFEIAGITPTVFTSVDDLRAVMDDAGADTVVVTSSDDLNPARIRELSWSLEPGREHLVLTSSLTDIGGPRIHTRPVAGLPLIHVETPVFGGRQRFAKRMFDIVASISLIIVSCPLLLVVAVLVKTTSPGPVLFQQERIGLNGNPFMMLKFRSMVVDAEARLAALRAQQTTAGNSVLFKMERDPRVTRVGAVLRRFSIDEIPQFFNVLRGDMSLIGPRPPLAREVEQYEDHVHRRFLMKPGITGLWQVSGRSNLSWEDTVRHDLYYVENWSMTEDIVILLKTVRAVFGSDGAY
ncbi:sugar transferase [Microbacteriaceae bacterium VKM Ac-2855]|nr:sugar transferase [Microbacteriaceae bacterium VKM Ac-2855]